MPVRLDEAGHGEPPAQIDDLGSGADELIDLGRGSNADDPLSADGKRLGLRRVDFEGLEAAVLQDDVGRLRE